MARMLQALKNLEARSARPARRGDAPAATPAVIAPSIEIVSSEASALHGASEESLVSSLFNWPQSAAPPAVETVGLRPAVAPTPPLVREAVPAAAPAGPVLRSRPPTALERQVQLALSDPGRSQPLVQLAERMRRDAEQTASKTLAVVGVGPESTTHETLLYAATSLAGKSSGEVLLVDADLARRQLSEALGAGQEPGLAELLRGGDSPRERRRPTVVAGLSFLPAGLLRHTDLSAAGPKLEDVLRKLAADFSLVLLDAGRSGDLAATTLARLADAAYFVVQLGTVETCEAQAALRDFRAAGARVLGCIAT
jgi:Mrp family chromosome partitioning ATPase